MGFLSAICSPHFETLFAGLLAEKVAPDGAVPDHAGGRRSAGRRESDWVRCKKILSIYLSKILINTEHNVKSDYVSEKEGKALCLVCVRL